MWKVSITAAFLALVGYAGVYVVRDGWGLWTVPAVLLLVGGVTAGFMCRRRRTSQVLATRVE